MKKWYGGTLIATLALLLLPCTFLRNKHPPSPQTLTGTIYPSWTKKAYLLSHLQGLPDLYSISRTANVSLEISRVTLTWAHMRPLLRRSDALPDTSKGVREAATAWRSLVDVLQRERIGGEEESVVKTKHCPSSVSNVDGGRKVEVPCGFVQDSAVTVIGVPNGGTGTDTEFGIELVGEKRGARPVVLQYLVRFPAGEGPDRVVILQNSCTEAGEWGEEEKCPSDGFNFKRQRKVDGLSVCNEQRIRPAINDTVVDNLLSSDESSNKTTGNRHMGLIFPYNKGQTFTATLWAGLQGFHMTVNGKHVTSFSYRKDLNPWLVNEVKVIGDVELLSLLANGLPCADDPDMIANTTKLKAPPLPKKKIFLLIGVFSTANNFARRMALRRTWMQYQAIRNGDVVVRFFTGLHTGNDVNQQLWREAQIYGDIQLMPFVDYYSLISLKTVAISIFGTKMLSAKYIMKTDDDAFVRVDEVYDILKKTYSNGLLYGLMTFESEPHRDMESKWYITEEEWPYKSYPPWAHGPGYIISRDIAKFIVEGHLRRALQLFKLEDVAVGIWIHEFKKKGGEVHYVNDDRFHSSQCEDGYVLAHYQGPRLILCLWEKLLKDHRPICCQ